MPGISIESIRHTYAQITLDYARQTRAYARSLRAYQDRVRIRPRPIRSVVATRFSAESHLPVSAPPAPKAPKSTAPLTGRQYEVARLIAQGMSNDEIARRLVLTPGTVGNHIGHILRRLGARNRAQVAAWVAQASSGIVPDRERAS
jgi:DNA-binding NarL/FixJ family response regulator